MESKRKARNKNWKLLFFVPFGLKLISTVRERSRVLVGGGILGRLDFLFASLLAFFIIHSPVLSLLTMMTTRNERKRASIFPPIVGRFLNGRAEQQQQRWNCVDGELNSYEGCQMNEFFFASSALLPLLTPPSLVVVAFFFIIVIAFMLLREKSASTTLNVNEGERTQAESSFIFTSTLTASLQLLCPPNKSHLPALLLCRMSFFSFSRCCCCLRVFWEVVVSVLYVLYIFFMYFKERAAKARKCFLCRSLLSTIFRYGCGAKFFSAREESGRTKSSCSHSRRCCVLTQKNMAFFHRDSYFSVRSGVI